MSVRKTKRDGKTWWIADYGGRDGRHQVRFRNRTSAERFHDAVTKENPSRVAETVRDWFTIAPRYRTKKRLLEMLK